MEELNARGIQVEVDQMKVIDLASKAENYDLIVTASKLNDVYHVPVVEGISIITGVGIDKTLEEVIQKLTRSSDTDKEKK